jgi:5-keto-L-gluconate epimerase
MRFSFLFPEPIPTLAELDLRMEVLASLGYQGVELSAFHPMGYTVDEIAGLSRKHRLPVVSLLTGWSYSHEGLCLTSPDRLVRGRAVCRLNDYVDHAARLNALIVIGLMQGLQSDEPDSRIAGERIVEGLRRVARTAEDRGVSVVLEPINHLQVGFNHSAASAAATVERVGSPAMSYMLDTFHLNIEEQSILGTVRMHAHRIRHFHLCETNGGVLGTGHVEFQSVLSALDQAGYSHFVSMKVYRQVPNWEEAAWVSSLILRAAGVWGS